MVSRGIGLNEYRVSIEPVRSYRDRILRVYDYIKHNLEGDLSVDRLSDVACLSPYHFHRVYRRFVGETLNGAARRCRLYYGGKLLADTPATVAEIAYRIGYNRLDSFSRAFYRFHGLSPEHYRQYHHRQRTLVAAATTYGHSGTESLSVAENTNNGRWPNSAWQSMYQVELVELPRIEMICLESDSTTEVLEPKFVDLNLHAQNYQLNLGARNFIGIFVKDPQMGDVVKFTHRYALAALPIDSAQRESLDKHLKLPFKLQSIPQGLYASYVYTGPYSMSERSHEWLFGYWMWANGLRATGASIIEEYLNDPRKVLPSHLKTRVFVQVERL